MKLSTKSEFFRAANLADAPRVPTRQCGARNRKKLFSRVRFEVRIVNLMEKNENAVTYRFETIIDEWWRLNRYFTSSQLNGRFLFIVIISRVARTHRPHRVMEKMSWRLYRDDCQNHTNRLETVDLITFKFLLTILYVNFWISQIKYFETFFVMTVKIHQSECTAWSGQCQICIFLTVRQIFSDIV